ncbi:co-chaperone GroES [Klebsiella pneumoniae]|nr:co-chaperone GroES [Klebsiella pneumoniae]
MPRSGGPGGHPRAALESRRARPISVACRVRPVLLSAVWHSLRATAKIAGFSTSINHLPRLPCPISSRCTTAWSSSAWKKKLSAGGIVIPDSATEKPIRAKSSPSAPARCWTTAVRAPQVKVGDKVLFGKYSGTEVKLDGVELLVVKEDDLFAILG